MLRRRRGKLQSAMEYLMTYGWAILAIAIVMVSLYSLGIFNTGNLQPTATPGSCEVVRTVAQTSFAGQCSNIIPKYVYTSVQRTSSIRIPYSNQFTNANFSVTVWFYGKSLAEDSGSVDNGMFGGYGTGGYGPDIALHLTVRSDKLYMGFYNDDLSGSNTLADNRWYFAVFVYDKSANKKYIYLDGALDSSGSSSSYYQQDSGNIYIGCETGCNNHFNGSIANVQAYNVSLDNATVKALYQEGIGGTPIEVNHLVGWWPLNGNANDYSGNNNQGTPTSVVWNANWQSGYAAPST